LVCHVGGLQLHWALAIGGVKDAVYIANLFLPLKAKLENMVNEYVSTLFNSY
jgi:hypothetical protein